MSTKVLIAEDEPLMRERLVTLLGICWPDADVIVVAENGNDAWDGFLEHEPRVVFLDIRMPGLSGLEVAQRIGSAAHVVFVSAYDQYAIDAFEAGAVDYLLKPVEMDRLRKAVDRIRQKLASQPVDLTDILGRLKAALPAGQRPAMRWIRANVGRQIKVIDIDHVLFFQSDTKYTRVVLAESEALIRTPIKDLLSQLDPDKFWQIHRGTIVAVGAIAAAERIDAERMQVLLKGGSVKLPVSRGFTHLFRE
ncbi:MAG: response regulator transcription factor [Betaproteobacteria bacterium]|nr:response regulator transcription factor [Betaproteobacteria bacterium]